MKKSAVFSGILACVTIFSVSFAQAGDLEWSGSYRIEWVHINNSELSDDNREKQYGLHHLVLQPKIVAADGVTIYSRFDLFNNSSFSNSQLGQVFGNGAVGGTDINNANTLLETQSPETLQVSQLYLSYIHEWGALIAGRAPLAFGLGMTHNAGTGEFDHWLDTRDLVGYKFVMGNLYILPMIGKVNEGTLNTNDDVTDYMVQAVYENPETDLSMGVFYQVREASQAGNDAPSGVFGGAAGPAADKFRTESINVFASKETEEFHFGVEVGQRNGSSGRNDSGANPVGINGLGVAGEFEWRPAQSKLKAGARFGWATGDDPATTDKMEGYFFDRNYDIAFLMFNHTLGRENFLQSAYVGGGPSVTGASANITNPDVEAITNAAYLAPYVNYDWADQWSLQGVLATGFLNAVANDGDKDLGFEIDINVIYRPNKRMSWVNQLGYLIPGQAFVGGTNNYDIKPAFGIATKAAISF